MNVVHKIETESVHKYVCDAAYRNTVVASKAKPDHQLMVVKSISEYDVGDQIIKFSMIFSKLILNDNHVLNPISGKIT